VPAGSENDERVLVLRSSDGAVAEQRIVSFLPAATEIVYALGLGDSLVGVSHECDFPPDVKGKPVVSRPALDLQNMTLAEVDRAISERVARGESIYRIDETLLRDLRPDLIITQDLCQVCAPSGNELGVALRALDVVPDVLFMSPHSLAEIEDNVLDLGRATRRACEAEAIVARRRERIAQVAARVQNQPRRRVVCMEWVEPIFCCGHWVPEMIELAGGFELLGRPGAESVRVTWEQVRTAAPEVLVVMPCGFHLDRALEQAAALQSLPGYGDVPAVRNGRVYAVDADSYFARPGPRIAEGVELLAHVIHPEQVPWNGPGGAFEGVPHPAPASR
jgi:iron complex transport system substrate-binding protein